MTTNDNWARAHASMIADRIENICAGNIYRCPHCDEAFAWNESLYDESTDTYTCPHCEEAVPNEEIDTYGLYDYLVEHILDEEYRIGADGQYRNVSILIEYGGPTTYIDTKTRSVNLHCGSTEVQYPLSSRAVDAIDGFMKDLYDTLRYE